MKTYRKRDFPVDKVRRFLEPGPIVLVSSTWKGEADIMTMGWHMMLGYDLFGCYIWDANHSHELIKRSKECVINLPTVDLVDKVDAPLIKECYANFECRLHDGSQIRKHNLFIWQVVKAHVATSPRVPQMLHYRGGGEFMVASRTISRRRLFKPGYL